MKKNVLIVDDDRILRRLIQKKFNIHADVFTTLLAADGAEAVKVLKEKPVSMVVTDLHMPVMDGFALLAHLSEKYPDIPVIVLTAFGTAQSKKQVLERGAAGFMEKPFVVEDLAQKILVALEKESEGGTLQSVPIEMFIQLVEMEQKTCTIRAANKETGKNGVLFFKSGVLWDARIRDMNGKPAVYEIFSWDKVSLSIQDDCIIKENRINEDLQALLFEAMRKKDETDADPDDFVETAEPPEPEPEPLSPAEALVERLTTISETRGGISEIVEDDKWDPLMSIVEALGGVIHAGDLKSCYINDGTPPGQIVFPGETATVVRLSADCPRDLIRQVLYD